MGIPEEEKGGMLYGPLIRDMVWSYSRIKSFEACPYRWFLNYIEHRREREQFYASYGSFMHALMAEFYMGKASPDEAAARFLTGFRDNVKGVRPSPELAAKYIEAGAGFLRGLRMPQEEIVGVEKPVQFELDGIPFVGFIDLLTRTETGLIVTDHKSRALKPKTGKSPPTKGDAEIDEMMRQLYLYSAAIKDEYGSFPERLRFNCFRNGCLIEEPFREEAYEEAVRWAVGNVRKIMDTESFDPNPDFFACRWLCGFSDYCEEGESV